MIEPINDGEVLAEIIKEADREEPMHVDEWIDQPVFDPPEGHRGDNYARWMLWHFRMPAIMQEAFRPFIRDRKLFCTYEGETYRCTGASRLGDVWLTSNREQDTGYEKRVDVEKCKYWRETWKQR